MAKEANSIYFIEHYLPEKNTHISSKSKKLMIMSIAN